MIYYAHPIYGLSPSDQKQIEDIKCKLQSAYLEIVGQVKIYDPSDLKITNEHGMSLGEWSACVFHSDIQMLDMCDTVLVTDFGRNISSGTAFEAGYAFAKGKKIIVIDMPSMTETSVMLHNCGQERTTYDAFIKLTNEKVIEFMNGFRSQRLKSKIEQH